MAFRFKAAFEAGFTDTAITLCNQLPRVIKPEDIDVFGRSTVKIFAKGS